MKTVVFQSALGPAMNQLLVIRRSLGYSDRTLPSYFASFDRYLVAHAGVGTWLTRATAEAWVSSDPNLTRRPPAHTGFPHCAYWRAI